jgi:two-component system, NarL family, response regulator NreC
MDTITIMLVDDHDVVRTGLRSYLETQQGFQVVAEARDGEEAVSLATEIRPQIILMDITMPHMDGLEATRKLKSSCPESLVLALTVHEDKQYFMEKLAAGASGYLTKQAAADELVAAIRAMATGAIYLQPALARWLLDDYQRLTRQSGMSIPNTAQKGAEVVSLDSLSPRERQVLELVGQGLNNDQIGKKLDLSPKTIARHRERIMNKLNMYTRTELVKFAIRTGLISLE